MKHPLRRLKNIVHEYRREIRFLLLFAIIFTVAQSLYYFSSSLTIPFKFQKSNAAVSALVINIVTPREEAFSKGVELASGNFSLQIAWGCEGVEGMFLVIAALAAFGMKRRDKIFGMAAGVMLLYILNIVRIVALYYTVKYRPALFDIMHIYVGQTFIIFFGVLFFVAWAYYFSPASQRESQPE